MRLLQSKPKSDLGAPARMGALIAGGKAILDLPATLDGAGRGGWLPASASCECWNLESSVWSMVRVSVEADQSEDEKTVEHWKKHGKVLAYEDAKICAPVP